MARQYSRELWARVKGLFISGCSVRDIARQCGIPAGSVAARCARERWANERNGVIETKDKIVTEHDSHSEAIAAVVLENKIATLIAESRSARLLAEKALAAVQNLSISGFDEIKEAQAFRQNLWPAVAPQSSQPPEQKPVLVLHYHHERPEVERKGDVVIELDGKPAAPKDSLPDTVTPSEKPKDL